MKNKFLVTKSIGFYIGVFLFGFLICFHDSFSQTKARENKNNGTISQLKPIQNYLPNVLIVKYNLQDQKLYKKDLRPQIKLKSANVSSVDRVFDMTSSELANIYKVSFSGNTPIQNIMEEILQDRAVEYCEPSYVHKVFYSPNDPLSPGNIYLDQIKAYAAWDIARNSSKIIIGIIDSGSEIGHEDLSSNIFVNNLDPINGIDDDNDGYIDNFYGWDFVGLDYNNPKEDNDPNVKSFISDHGIHVSGLAAAVSDNAKGTSSVSFNAQLLIVKCAADNNRTAIVNGFEGIKYAVDHGAQIINCSWGGEVNSLFGRDIINYALSKGCMIVAAAGNENTAVNQYPAAYPGVLAVSSVDHNDIKSMDSNFGQYVGLSAPGVNILSTTFSNSYGQKSGTSMATPIVASAAALLKSYFGNLSMEQIVEKLKVSADPIEYSNPNYVGKLGSGRLNIYRALTLQTPSLRYQNIVYSNQTKAGDTIEITLDIKNYLDKTDNLELSISSTNKHIEILTKSISSGSLNTLTSKKIGPFKVFLKPDMPANENIQFRINYSDMHLNYSDHEYFQASLNLDYLNYNFNKISTTATSIGRVGYRDANAETGVGFILDSKNILYEASLILATSENQISNNARINLANADEDFVSEKIVYIKEENDTVFSVSSEFSDLENSRKLNVSIKHNHIVYKGGPRDKLIIIEYEVYNKNSFVLNNFHLGLFTDWDIGLDANDITKFIIPERLAYATSKFDRYLYSGLKLLNNDYPINYYPLTDAIDTNPLSDGLLTTAEKYKIISNGTKYLGLGEELAGKSDISFTAGYGPTSIPSNGSKKFAFAFLVGNSIEDLQISAKTAQSVYLGITKPVTPAPNTKIKGIFPNPIVEEGIVLFSIPNEDFVTLTIYDLYGQRLLTLVDEKLSAGEHSIKIDASKIMNGVYICQIKYKSFKESIKFIISH